MTREQISRFLVEARNPDGTLVFPEWGGCWHTESSEWIDTEGGDVCPMCGEYASNIVDNEGNPERPDLYTWPSFGILWPRMQKREDWEHFVAQRIGEVIAQNASDRFCGNVCLVYDNHINPDKLPAIIYAWLTREES